MRVSQIRLVEAAGCLVARAGRRSTRARTWSRDGDEELPIVPSGRANGLVICSGRGAVAGMMMMILRRSLVIVTVATVAGTIGDIGIEISGNAKDDHVCLAGFSTPFAVVAIVVGHWQRVSQ